MCIVLKTWCSLKTPEELVCVFLTAESDKKVAGQQYKQYKQQRVWVD